MKAQTISLPIKTPDGTFLAHYSEKGLVELSFPGRHGHNGSVKLEKGMPAKIHAWHRTTEAALTKALTGAKPKKFPPFHAEGTEFQKSVWREMRKIAGGKTKSYGEIAEAIGKPKAMRAVGGACGANPIPVFVPCHRVLAANKKIGGFSGGREWKRKLLAREGITVDN